MYLKQAYPKRVTLGEDGVYKWSVDVDLKEDEYSRNLFMRCMYIITGSVLVVMLLIMFVQQDFSLVWVPVLCYAAVLLIGVASYRIYRACVHDVSTMSYEMGKDDILLIRSPAEQKMMKTLGVLTATVGRGPAYNTAAEPVRTAFHSVRRMREYPEKHMVTLTGLLVTNVIRIPAEDYDEVVRYLREHTKEAVRKHGDMGLLKRVGIAAALSAGVNAVIAVINYIGFVNTKRLPISFTSYGGVYATQDAFAMQVIYVPEGIGFEAPWWANRLEMNSGNALLWFLAAMTFFFLVLTVINIFRAGSRNPEE